MYGGAEHSPNKKKSGSLVYLEVYVMSAGTRSGKVLRKNTTAAKDDKMLPSASAQTCDIMFPQNITFFGTKRKKWYSV